MASSAVEENVQGLYRDASAEIQQKMEKIQNRLISDASQKRSGQNASAKRR
jgi:hypothetical protein